MNRGGKRIIWEVLRKLVHLGALVIPTLYWFLPWKFSITVLSLVTFGVVLADVSRLIHTPLTRFIYRKVGHMLRRHEYKKFTGASYILTASLLVILVFPKPIAVTVLVYIIVGDTAASIFGKLFGRTKLTRGKSLEGSLAFLTFAFLASVPVPYVPTTTKFLGAMFATFIEFLPLKLDDNLTVPVLTGLFLKIIAGTLVG
ncbi:hypothetical protein J7K18_04425 [bacterium]|nr:hypothetical protein [bacterium]